jgi:hypothetical protein
MRIPEREKDSKTVLNRTHKYVLKVHSEKLGKYWDSQRKTWYWRQYPGIGPLVDSICTCMHDLSVICYNEMSHSTFDTIIRDIKEASKIIRNDIPLVINENGNALHTTQPPVGAFVYYLENVGKILKNYKYRSNIKHCFYLQKPIEFNIWRPLSVQNQKQKSRNIEPLSRTVSPRKRRHSVF